MNNDINSLPKWAQLLIHDLKQDNDKLHKLIEAFTTNFTDSTVYADVDIVSRLHLPQHSVLCIKQFDLKVTIHALDREKCISVYMEARNGQAVIEPRATNLIHIVHRGPKS